LLGKEGEEKPPLNLAQQQKYAAYPSGGNNKGGAPRKEGSVSTQPPVRLIHLCIRTGINKKKKKS